MKLREIGSPVREIGRFPVNCGSLPPNAGDLTCLVIAGVPAPMFKFFHLILRSHDYKSTTCMLKVQCLSICALLY